METPFQRRIITTADGSNTFELVGKGEHYHSTFGAVQESSLVFIKNGLLSLSGKNKLIRILEVGIGTGLNALLTLFEMQKMNLTVHYHGLEPFALEAYEYKMLNYTDIIGQRNLQDAFLKFHESEWNKDIEWMPGFVFRKEKAGLGNAVLPENFFDLVYFDAFGPDTQPELWAQPMFEKIAAAMKPCGVLTTYCAKGIVRRAMRASGLAVEKLPGPPGKREMTRAVKK